MRYGTTTIQPLYWGLLHGVNDFAAGFFLAGYTLTHDYGQSFLMVSLYAILGFGGQLPAGIWLDRRRNLPEAARLSLFLLPAALLVYFIDPAAAIIVSGLASAWVHVTGGAICLQVHDNKTGPLGLFTAPGVLGLTLGGLLGNAGIGLPFLLLAAVGLLGLLILRTPIPGYQPPEQHESELDRHDWLMLLLLLIMCFRSFIYDVVNYVAEYREDAVLYIGLSAFAGKILGGFAADRFGKKRFVYVSLLAALLFLQFGKQNVYALCAGIACLQSSVPLTLHLMGRFLPAFPATATGFSLGVTVLLAGLPLYLLENKAPLYRLFSQPYLTAGLFLLFLLGWLAAMRWMSVPSQSHTDLR